MSTETTNAAVEASVKLLEFSLQKRTDEPADSQNDAKAEWIRKQFKANYKAIRDSISENS